MLNNDEHRFSPDFEDLPRLFFTVGGGGDDEQAVQQVNGDSVRALVVCTANTGRGREINFNVSVCLTETPQRVR